MTEIKKIVKKYRKKKWLLGQYIPTEERKKYRIMFIGEKPSLFFLQHPELRCLGNYNATGTDIRLQEQIKKYKLGKIYITDMVKTEGVPGAKFEKEWHKDKSSKKCIIDGIKIVRPSLFVVLSRKTEKLFTEEFPQYRDKTRRIYQPGHVCRFNRFKKWNHQFAFLVFSLKK